MCNQALNDWLQYCTFCWFIQYVVSNNTTSIMSASLGVCSLSTIL